MSAKEAAEKIMKEQVYGDNEPYEWPKDYQESFESDVADASETIRAAYAPKLGEIRGMVESVRDCRKTTCSVCRKDLDLALAAIDGLMKE